jgi:hypothetical protein
MAGKLGDGGGPGRPGTLFPPIRLVGPSKAQMLQVGAGDARHQRVPMQTGPGAAFEVVEAEFLLELLVDLLSDPACLDRADQDAPGRTGRQVREVEFALTRGTPLAHQPDLVARQMLNRPGFPGGSNT